MDTLVKYVVLEYLMSETIIMILQIRLLKKKKKDSYHRKKKQQ